MKVFKRLSQGIDLIIIIPIIGLLIIIFIPIGILIFVTSQIKNYKDKKELKKLIQVNNGKLFFLYADYNNYDFTEIIGDRYKDLELIKINHPYEYNLFSSYLTKDLLNKSYPRLVKLKNNNLIHKEHYNSFRKLYKKENNIEAFLDLIDRSIINLKKENIA